MPDWETVRALGSTPPDVEEGTSYEDYPLVLIALGRVDAEELGELLIESWRERPPKRVLAAYDAGEAQRQAD